MKKAIVGKKLGMTQIFLPDGRLVPVTVIQAGPCTVVQKKTLEKDGYEAVQFGFDKIPENRVAKLVNKPDAGHFNKAGVAPPRALREFRFGQQLLGAVFGHLAETDLNGFVAVALNSLCLHHGAGARFNHGDRYETAVFGEDLRHTDLFTHDRFLHCICSSCLTVSFRFRHQQEDQASSWRPPSWSWGC